MEESSTQRLRSMYSLVYHGFTVEFKLKPVSVILLALMVSFHKDKKFCWLSLESLAMLTGTTEPTVLKHLELLRKKGLIERKPKHPKFGTNQWGLGFEGVSKLLELQRKVESKRRK